MADDYSKFTRDDELPVPPRPSKGGASATWGPPVTPVRTTPNVGFDHLNPVQKQLRAGAEGYAKGVTAGLFDYAPAGLAWVLDRIRKKGPAVSSNVMPPEYVGTPAEEQLRKLQGQPIQPAKPVTFNESLAATRQRAADVQQQYPVAHSIGQLGGAVHLGIRGPGTNTKIGKSVPGAMALQGVQGAVSKLTESPETTLKDAAWAGATSAALTGAAPLVGRATDFVNKGFGNMFMKSASNAVTDALEAATKAKGAPLTGAEQQAVWKTAMDQFKTGPLYTKAFDDTFKDINETIIPAIAGGVGAAYMGYDPLYGIGSAIAAKKATAIGNYGTATAKWVGRLAESKPGAVAKTADKFKHVAPAAVRVVEDQARPKKQTVINEDDYSGFTEDDYSAFTKE